MSSGNIRNVAVTALMLVASRFPESTMAVTVFWVAIGYLLLDTFVRARTGYRRRLRFWTAASWRRDIAVSAIPIGALLSFFGILFAIEFRIRAFCTAGTTLRWCWVVVALMVMFLARSDSEPPLIGWSREMLRSNSLADGRFSRASFS